MPRTRDREGEVGKATTGLGLTRPQHGGHPGRRHHSRHGGASHSRFGTGNCKGTERGGSALIGTALLSTLLALFNVMLSSTSTLSTVGSMALAEATISTTSRFAKSQLRPIQPRPWLNRGHLWPFPGNVGLQKGPWVLVQGDEPQDMLPRKAQGQRALLR